MDCIFCQLPKENWVSETSHFFAVWDIDPIQEGHLLVIAKAHRLSLSELTTDERLDLLNFQEQLIEKLERSSAISGVTIAINNGRLMDEGTHFHSHLIPRYENDGFWDNLVLKNHPFDKSLF
ncbi:HIT family protein [Streptococcus hillyeri]|uniref:HIT family protein n=1 Tax=Streptococcus hillyeri TaxID=2282420 RepID=A0A3L9DVR5_9STRE|nr:HIT family protein [Streptococcus hillyeri]RLY03977.1 HIT family protein [Streptococcus hillyeri]